jgi:hypothetical protein
MTREIAHLCDAGAVKISPGEIIEERLNGIYPQVMESRGPARADAFNVP